MDVSAALPAVILTVVLLVLAMILIYAGTWAQIDAGIWQVSLHPFEFPKETAA